MIEKEVSGVVPLSLFPGYFRERTQEIFSGVNTNPFFAFRVFPWIASRLSQRARIKKEVGATT
ncbi:MAG: hypothetical protein ABDK92_10280 [Atribacterota bacterium]